jgi:hypothetical protein
MPPFLLAVNNRSCYFWETKYLFRSQHFLNTFFIKHELTPYQKACTEKSSGVCKPQQSHGRENILIHCHPSVHVSAQRWPIAQMWPKHRCCQPPGGSACGVNVMMHAFTTLSAMKHLHDIHHGIHGAKLWQWLYTKSYLQCHEIWLSQVLVFQSQC